MSPPPLRSPDPPSQTTGQVDVISHSGRRKHKLTFRSGKVKASYWTKFPLKSFFTLYNLIFKSILYKVETPAMSGNKNMKHEVYTETFKRIFYPLNAERFEFKDFRMEFGWRSIKIEQDESSLRTLKLIISSNPSLPHSYTTAVLATCEPLAPSLTVVMANLSPQGHGK